MGLYHCFLVSVWKANLMSYQNHEILCSNCNSNMNLWMSVPGDYRHATANDSYLLYRCMECEFGQILPRPNQDDISKFYEIDDYFTHDEIDGKDGKSIGGLGTSFVTICRGERTGELMRQRIGGSTSSVAGHTVYWK